MAAWDLLNKGHMTRVQNGDGGVRRLRIRRERRRGRLFKIPAGSSKT